MKIIPIEQRTPEWDAWRRAKISGTKALAALPMKRGAGKRAEYWELLAEQFATEDVEDVPQNAADRGTALESDNLQITCAKLRLYNYISGPVWERKDGICVSPDAFENIDNPSWAVELKSLGTANHFKAFYGTLGKSGFEAVPEDFKTQILQYYLVNDHLQTVYMGFYNPVFSLKAPQIAHFIITTQRSEIEEEIQELLDLELTTIAQIQEEVNKINEYLERN